MFKNYIYYVILCVPTIRPFLLVFREIEGHNQGHGLRRKNLLNALSTIIDLMQTLWPDNDLILQILLAFKLAYKDLDINIYL